MVATAADADLPGKSERGPERLEAFTDAVLAIVMTLLALELRPPEVPEGADAMGAIAAVLAHWPAFAVFAVSFLFIALYWANHHQMLNVVARVDHLFLMINILFLLVIATVPFAMRFFSENIGHPGAENGAALVFASVAWLCALTFNLVWWYAVRAGLVEDITPARMRRIRIEYALGIAFGFVGIVVALVSAWAMVAMYFAPAVFYALPRAGTRRGAARGA